MKKTLSIAGLCVLLIANTFAMQYQKTESGIKTTSNGINIEVKFYSPTIVRVLKSPLGNAEAKKSLSVIKTPEKTDLKTVENANEVTVSSAAVKVVYNGLTGKITFLDSKGNLLFTEKENGVQFTPRLDASKQSYTVQQAFVLDKNEAIYGLGQQQNGKLNQRNQQVLLKQDNMKVAIPYFLSVKGYGVFWDNYSPTTFSDTDQATSFESMGDCADYYFMYGKTGTGVVAQMRDLTGQAPMFPLWTYGFWQSRERYKSQFELVEVVKKYRSLKVPLDGIIQDWRYWGVKDSMWNGMVFDPKTFPAPQAMIDSVHQMNTHIMIVAWPGFGPQTKQFADFKDKNMQINFSTWPPRGGAKPYDVYNPSARDLYWDYLNKGVFSLGNDSWWLDSAEPDHVNPKDVDFDQPTYLGSYRSVTNAFPLMHTKGVYEHQRATTSDKRVYILTRSAFAGQQRHGANTWSGDVRSTWETLQKQIPAALNFSLSGIPYWNADIGGFFAKNFGSNGTKNPEFQELYVRWLQFATFTPMMRSHGSILPREIYQFGKAGDWAYDAIAKNINFRYKLLPYLYSTAWKVTSESASIINALPLMFNDEKVRDINDEFMFGNSILVAPVINPMYTGKKDAKVYADFSAIKSRKVYLPGGNDWFDFWTGLKMKGGQEITRETPIDITPLYIKAGTILPLGPTVQFANEKKWDNLEVRVYPGANGEFMLYEDENDNYNYEKGIYSTITLKWNEQSRTLTIGERKGSFPGMIQNRTFKVYLVSKNNGAGLTTKPAVFKTVKYSGKSEVVKF